MASVTLRFDSPDADGLVALRIYESDTPDGAFTEIQRTTEIGTHPDYIIHFTTDAAENTDDWFAIAWEDDAGSISNLSEAVQGGTTTYIGELLKRVILRMPTVNENIIQQEAEAVIEDILKVDPYSAVTTTVKYKTWNGMAFLVMARVQLSEIASNSGQTQSFTAGLVSMKSDTSGTLKLDDVKKLLDQAARMLGFSTARIVQMCVPTFEDSFTEVVMADISRLEIDVA